MTRLEKIQPWAFWLVVVAAGAGFLTSVGVTVGPPLTASAARWFYPVVIAVGVLSGAIGRRRCKEVDSKLWEIVEDYDLTSGERKWAHKDAERGRRIALSIWIAVPLTLGYWLAYLVEGGELLIGHLLPVAGILGVIPGWMLGKPRG